MLGYGHISEPAMAAGVRALAQALRAASARTS
jgi:hypothetical protein